MEFGSVWVLELQSKVGLLTIDIRESSALSEFEFVISIKV